jgi:hypothetical protein
VVLRSQIAIGAPHFGVTHALASLRNAARRFNSADYTRTCICALVNSRTPYLSQFPESHAAYDIDLRSCLWSGPVQLQGGETRKLTQKDIAPRKRVQLGDDF